ncbi:hypothetical protein MTR67_018138 [Solanum verrucosum]|uniref:Gag-pol polyprotein n=1 Tax=Solanum verrucosum TaxID=315347 RepID=A0AAF0QLV7_SOLVR|nr:hypothetical protein MTR67_018138 [Solanum verrucosum]
MGVTSIEKVELASCQLNGVAQIRHDQWTETRQVGLGPIEWQGFKSAFLDRFFPLEMREASVLMFINIKQVSDPKSEMSKFVTGLPNLVAQEFRTSMFEHNMNITRLIVYAFEIEQKKLEERLKDKKRVRMDDGNSSLERSFG